MRSNTVPDFPESYKRRMVKYTRPLRPRPDPTGKIALMTEQLRNKQPWTFEDPRPKLETMKDQLVAAVDEKYPRMPEIMRLSLDATENKHLVRLMLALDKDDNNTLRDELLSCLNEEVALLAAEDTNQVVKLVIASLERFVVQKYKFAPMEEK